MKSLVAGDMSRFGLLVLAREQRRAERQRSDPKISELDSAVPRVDFEFLRIETIDVLAKDANRSAANVVSRVSDLEDRPFASGS